MSPLVASPIINIVDYDTPIDFKNMSVVKINNQDSPMFKDPHYDDDAWPVISVPSKWEKVKYPGYMGVCWYRIHVKFPAETLKQAYGVNLGKISDKDETYFNGVKIGGLGDINDPESHAYEISRIYEIPGYLIKPGEVNILAIRIKNYFPGESGLINGIFEFDYFNNLRRSLYIHELFNFGFVVIYGLIAFYFLFFFFRVKKYNENFVFGLFCIAFATYILLRTEFRMYAIDHFVLLKKIEYVAFYSLAPLFLFFTTRYYRKKLNIVLKIYYIITILTILVVIFTNEPFYWNFMTVYLVEFLLVIPVGTILFNFFQHRHERSSRFMLYTFGFFSFTIIFDILYLRNIIKWDVISVTGLLTKYGFFVFMMTIASTLSNNFFNLYKLVEIKTSELSKTLIERNEAYKKIDAAYLEVINRVGLIAEYRDPETGKHINRVAIYVKLIAEKLGLDDITISNLYYAAPMHDVGKIGIPDKILFKQGPLTAEEWEVMKSHTIIGAHVFANAESQILKVAKEIALSHHEKWDGTGYPYGLAGEDIFLSGRIMAIADVYDALRSKRSYKNEMSHKKVVEIITEGDNRTKPEHFDPKILAIFKEVADEFDRIYEENRDPE